MNESTIGGNSSKGPRQGNQPPWETSGLDPSAPTSQGLLTCGIVDQVAGGLRTGGFGDRLGHEAEILSAQSELRAWIVPAWPPSSPRSCSALRAPLMPPSRRTRLSG
jgi:hypothetical protein